MNAPVVDQWLNAIWAYVSIVALVIFLCAGVRFWRQGYRLDAVRTQLVISLAVIAFGSAFVRGIVMYAYYARTHGGGGDGLWAFLSRFVQFAGILCVAGTLGAIRASTWDRWKEHLWITVLVTGILVAIAVHLLLTRF